MNNKILGIVVLIIAFFTFVSIHKAHGHPVQHCTTAHGYAYFDNDTLHDLYFTGRFVESTAHGENRVYYQFVRKTDWQKVWITQRDLNLICS